MKIYDSTFKIYQNPLIQRSHKNSSIAEKTNQTAQNQTTQNKVNIPEDYRPELTLNSAEKKFFEKLYPQDRKKINRYLQNQNKIQVEKGQIIDVRG